MTELQVSLVISGLVIVFVCDLIAIAARAAMRHSSLARLIHLRELNEPHAGHTLAVLEKMPRSYAALHIAQSLLRFVLLGMVYFLIRQDARLDTFVEAVGIFLIVGLVVAWLEWMIERRVVRNPEQWALRLTGWIRYINLIFYPLASLSLIFSRETSRPDENIGAVTEDTLKTLVDVGQKDGILEVGERKMIHSIFQLGDTLTREIMVPRIDVQGLEIGASLSEAVAFLLSSGFSRVPVYEETIDNVLGLLYAKDLLQFWQEENGAADIRRDLLREAYFVPEAKKVGELLEEMQKRRTHMAIVVDEYGGVAGVVTLEDIIEEIFGEIQDEYDEEEELPFRKLENGDYLFRGRIDLDDFNDLMGCNLPRDEADTLSGFIYARLGHVPAVGESVRDANLLLTVELVSNRRIRKVRAQFIR
ncbi:MAG: HlyC/CorC family transporter [Chloroflexi bacterium]|nr:HlyC/CorC family transporter [Chloroflexota bacterium]